MQEWLKKAVFYQIFPPSFQDENGDGIGDLAGIRRRLPELQALGIDALWLNPCYVSPFADAGYDVADHCRVAPRYGTNEELRALIGEVHARGMHLLLDLVPGHTSIEHPWCKASMLPQRGAYTDRYVWTGSIDEDFAGVTGIRAGLQGISQRDGVLGLNCFCSQPALNYGFARCDRPWQQPVDAPGPRATRAALLDVMRFWLRMGADGFRVDMAGSLVKNDPDGTATAALWRGIRAELRPEFPGAVLVSEWGDAARAFAAGFDMDFTLHFGASHYPELFRTEHPYFCRGGGGDASAFLRYYQQSMQAGGLVCIPTGNHDMERLRSRLSEAECALAFVFVLTMPGVPFLYYGDEIGLRQARGLDSVEGGYDRTGARTPMQWDDGPNAGFSAAPAQRLYLPVDPDPARPTVAAQRQDPQSLYGQVRRLIALRRAHPALQAAGTLSVASAGEPGRPLVYSRAAAGEQLTAAINPAAQPAALEWDGEVGRVLYQIGGAPAAAGGRLVLPAGSAAVFCGAAHPRGTGENTDGE
jgi:glycosidase